MGRQINRQARANLNFAGFLTFVALSCATAVGLLVLASLAATWLLDVNTVWAIPIGIGLLGFLGFVGELSTDGSPLRAKLPKRLRGTPAENIKDIYIAVSGTGVGCLLAYALSRSLIVAMIVGALVFIYFYVIQSAIRASRSGLKLIPKWRDEQQGLAESTVLRLRSGDAAVDGTYCLFLRPFNALPYEYNIYRDEYIPAEERIAETLHEMCPVIAIGGQLPVGPGYINTEEEAWKADVVLLMRHAGMILVLPAATAGMEFEIAHILAQDYLPKTLFLGPPTARDTEPWEVTWRKMTVQLERHGLDVPEYRPSGMAFHYLPEQTTAVVQELSGDIGNLEQLRQFVVSAIT